MAKGAGHAVTLPVGFYGIHSIVVGRPCFKVIKAHAEDCRRMIRV